MSLRPLLPTAVLVGGLLVATLSPASAQDSSLHTWVPTGQFASSSFERVPRVVDDVPEQPDHQLRASAVRNGHVSGQIAVTSDQDITDLRVQPGTLHREGGGGLLARSAVQVRYPQFVPVVDSEDSDAVTTAPLQEHASVDVPAGNAQPVWLTVAVPERTKPGTYTGEVSVTAAGEEPVTYSLSIEVSPVTLPAGQDLDFRTDYWFQPDPVADFHDVQPWSEEHWALLETYLRDMVTRGQKVINVAITEDPWLVEFPDGSWHSQTYTPWESLIEWHYDGSEWSFDYEKFDRYIELHHSLGISDEIHVFSLLSFGGRERFTYFDADGEKVIEDVELGSDRWREGWTAFLTEFQSHMTDKGWMDKTYLAFDERPAEVMAEVTALLEDTAPELLDKLSIASYHGDVEQIAADYSMIVGLVADFSIETTRERRREGKTTTFYTIGADATPNTVVSIPPIGTRMLGWTAAQADLDGMLRWSYNSWPGDVYETGAFRYAQGDEYIVYPGEDGPVSSIAWEMFRDGIEDAELVHMLRERTGQDSPILEEIFDGVETRAPATPEQYAALLEARTQLVAELERTGDLAADVTPELGGSDSDPLDAGQSTQVQVEVDNPTRSDIEGLQVDLAVPDGWTVDRLDDADGSIPSGQSTTATFDVSAPLSASGESWLSANVQAARGSDDVAFDSYASVDVNAAVELNLDRRWRGADGATEVSVTGQVANVTDQEVTATAELSAPEGWTTTEPGTELTIPAGEQVPVEYTLTGEDVTEGTVEGVLEILIDDVTVADGPVVINRGGWLSDLPWERADNGWGPVERDMSNGEDAAGDGGKLTIGDETYQKGLGAHAPSHISYHLDGQYEEFTSWVGPDPEVVSTTGMTFEVWVDDEMVYDSGVMELYDPAERVEVDVTDADLLELIITPGPNGDTAGDHGNWAEARLS
ncbi:MAG TPA: glycoside hydrolase domain-containing protein [Jiangellaceae bacterium]|nr:glycoside hydrolase domain-containing protein [Jiangellaceae bacterium]